MNPEADETPLGRAIRLARGHQGPPEKPTLFDGGDNSPAFPEEPATEKASETPRTDAATIPWNHPGTETDDKLPVSFGRAIERELSAALRQNEELKSKLRIYTKCPACGNDTLVVNDDHHLLCTWHKCPNPVLIDKQAAEVERLRRALEKIASADYCSQWSYLDGKCPSCIAQDALSAAHAGEFAHPGHEREGA